MTSFLSSLVLFGLQFATRKRDDFMRSPGLVLWLVGRSSIASSCRIPHCTVLAVVAVAVGGVGVVVAGVAFV